MLPNEARGLGAQLTTSAMAAHLSLGSKALMAAVWSDVRFSPRKQTSPSAVLMSAWCHFRTKCTAAKIASFDYVGGCDQIVTCERLYLAEIRAQLGSNSGLGHVPLVQADCVYVIENRLRLLSSAPFS
jgi:hypothetical protein